MSAAGSQCTFISIPLTEGALISWWTVAMEAVHFIHTYTTMLTNYTCKKNKVIERPNNGGRFA